MDDLASTFPVEYEPAALLSILAGDLEAVEHFARAEKSEATQRAYRSDFVIFRTWCDSRGVAALPASAATVATFIASEAQAGVRPSTIGRRLAAIRYAHKLAEHETPTGAESVRVVMRGIRRTVGVRPNKKTPATADKLLAMVSLAPPGMVGLRDRALLLLGFGGAFRRSELVAIDVENLTEKEAGLRVFLPRSKTDQEGVGRTVGVVRGSVACPVAAVLSWMAAAGISTGPLFRPVNKGGNVGPGRLTDRSVAEIVKRYALKLNFDPTQFAGHSLRRGFLTSANGRGANIFRMMDVSGHRSVDTLREYVDEAEMFRDHAGAGLL